MEWPELLDRGVMLVSGKGGTGKSTVAAALAVAGSAMGRRTLLVEVEGRGEMSRTLGVPDPGFTERVTPFGPSVLSISPRDAALEYLRIYGGADRLVRPLMRRGVIEEVITMAPGFRDLLVCGKLYEIGHVRRTDPRDSGRPQYDLIVVDGPPTGQIAAFLAAPSTFAELIRMGPLRRRASKAARFLRRWGQLVLVTVPEEMAVAETLETIPAVSGTGVRLGAIVLNRTVTPPFPPGARRAFHALDGSALVRAGASAGLELGPEEARLLLQEAGGDVTRHRAQRAYRQELSRAGPVLDLPEIVARGPRPIALALASTIGTGPAPAVDHLVLAVESADVPRTNPSIGPHVSGARILVVCGSGGVGKTSVSAALAIHAATSGTKTMLLTVDPARRLATALRLPMLAGERTSVGVGGGHRLEAMQLDTKRTFDDLIRRYAGTPDRRDRILSNAYYRRIVDTLAGTHEYMAMEKLYELAEEEDHELIVIDTPPTRSALAFLDAPARLTDFLGGRFLRWMLMPAARAGRLTVSAARFGAGLFLRTAGRLVGAEALADAIDFLASFEGMYGGFKDRAARVVELMRSPQCAVVVVASPTSVSLGEAGYFERRLRDSGMRLAAVVVNRTHLSLSAAPDRAGGAARALAKSGRPQDRAAAAVVEGWIRRGPRRAVESSVLAEFARAHRGTPLLSVPDLPGDVHDIGGLRRLSNHLFGSGR